MPNQQINYLPYFLKFNGQNDHIVLSKMNVDYSQGFTIEAWVYYNSFKFWSRIIDFGNGVDKDNIVFANEANTNTLILQIKKITVERIRANNILETGKWMHLAATVDSSGNGKLYKNGAEIQSGKIQLPGNFNRSLNYIGRSNWTQDGYFDGQMAEVRLWNRARSVEELQQDLHRRLEGKEAGLVQYWPLNEGTSNIANDKFNIINQAIIYGATWQQQQTSIQADTHTNLPAYFLSFDGIDDFVDIGKKPEFKIEKTLTVEAWVYPEQQKQWAGIFGNIFDTGFTESGYGLCLDGASGVNFACTPEKRGIQYLSSGSKTLTLSQWQHITGTYNGQEMKVYVNGVLKATKAISANKINYNPENNLRIGVYQDDNEAYNFKGKIAEVRLWNCIRSEAEIQSCMYTSLRGNEPGLVGYWPLNEGSTTTVKDVTSCSNNGKITGAIWDRQLFFINEILAQPQPSAFKQENIELTHTVSELEEKNTEQDKQLSELKQNNTKLDKKVAELKPKNGEQDKQLSELKQKNAELDNKVVELEQKNTEQDRQLSELKQKNAELDKKVAESEQKNIEQVKKLSKFKQKNAQLDKKVVESKHNNTELNKQLSELKQKNIDQAQQIAELEQKNAQHNIQLAELDKKVAESEQNNVEQDKQLLELKQKESELENKNAEFVEKLSELSPKIIVIDSKTVIPQNDWQQLQKLQPADLKSESYFGEETALSGEWAIAGARKADRADIQDAGIAYAFQLQNQMWLQKQQLQPNDTRVGDQFGSAVAMSQEWAIIGARKADYGIIKDVGAAYIYQLADGIWQQKQKLQPSDLNVNSSFGKGIAINGNWAIIGASHAKSTTIQDAGAAYVFYLENGVWQQKQKLQPEDLGVNQCFGNVIAMTSEWAIIGGGDRYTSASIKRPGGAYIYHLENGVWQQKQKLNSPRPGINDLFGYSVAISGEYAFVGAVNTPITNILGTGSVYIYKLIEGVWQPQQLLQPSQPKYCAFFGATVAIANDIAVIGSTRADSSKLKATGDAHIFKLEKGVWQLKEKLQPTDLHYESYFGFSTPTDREWIFTTAAWANTSTAKRVGAVYVFASR
ncbi:MAG: LamG-like jellyroll fold domain-containing protein [Nostoc sp. ChiQUE01a]|nr:LamG-like jellyroll fold domain-containing protein [Nostoc sp. ChiQUE01a]